MSRSRRRATAVATALAMALASGFAAGWFVRGSVGAGEPPAQAAGTSAVVTAQPVGVGARGCPSPRRITTLPGTAPTVALTFDDGPSEDTTSAILAILAAKGVRATFFETGEHASSHPQLVADVVAGGHAVGSHSWNHPRLTELTAAQVADQLERSNAAVSAAAGTRVCLMRPPFGLTDRAVDGIIDALGLTQVGWTHNPKDWLNPTPEQLRRDSAPWPGSPPTILLLHEHGREDVQQVGPSPTVAALPHIIDDYVAAGYTFVQTSGRPFPRDGARPGAETSERQAAGRASS